ncbi:CMRF35-like molecule 5 [Myxocyprinus asiaticus]|uniref:CMRF35-like molecule 5 n=1 Tax=Myxocyprinus asiaticus TaxID=70543 RepID=UPI002223B8AC|nr:CMRF35-like molecule 5 [Myxocyprinus asiaticus]
MLVMKMKTLHVLWIWIFLSGFRIAVTNEINIHGYSGRYLTILCSHTWAQNNRKYFCRDPCKNEDILVASDRSPNGRFRLDDSGEGIFSVTISELQESDSGVYWCGVDRPVAVDTYNKVTLTVSKVTQTSTEVYTTLPSPTPTTHKESQSSTTRRTSRYSTPDDITHLPSVTMSVYTSLYAVGGLVIMVIILAVGLVAVLKFKKKVQTSAIKECHNEYRVEEANSIYKNDLPDVQMKSNHKTEVPTSQSDSVYEHVKLSMGKSDTVYGNL